MRLSAYYVLLLLVIWLAYGGWTTARTYRGGGRHDRGSKLVFVAGIFTPFLVGALLKWADLGPSWRAHAGAFEWTGGTVMLAGIALWMRAIATLGQYFSVNVDIPEDHRLIETGVYRWIRHPAYAGMILTETGFGIATASALVAVAFLVIPTAAFLHRIRVEEAALIQELGEPYRAYARRTRRLIPFAY